MAITDNKMNLGAIGALGLALIFGIVVPAHNGIFTMEISMGGNTINQNIGLWKTDVDGECPDGAKNDCDTCAVEPGSDATDCAKAGYQKCKTMQAFSILGVLAVAAAAGLAVAGGLGVMDIKMTGMAGAAAAAFGAFSYLIIFAICAANYNGELSADSDCGSGGSDNDNFSYGASFAIAIVNWLLLTGTAGALFMASRAPAKV